jgi:peptidoglycan hydrolase-like protein with peptidoglycan-binding domain
MPAPRPDTGTIARTRSDLVADTQRELKQLGFYDGTIDGMRGPRTDQAVRDFEQAQGLKVTGEPSAMLLDMMRRARVKPETTGTVPTTKTETSVKAETTASLPSRPHPSTRVLAVQRVLARLGYGPLKLNGLHDPSTRSAINQFERDRGLARSGEIDERLIAELTTVTGGPLE